jgi:hypothetical protein
MCRMSLLDDFNEIERRQLQSHEYILNKWLISCVKIQHLTRRSLIPVWKEYGCLDRLITEENILYYGTMIIGTDEKSKCVYVLFAKVDGLINTIEMDGTEFFEYLSNLEWIIKTNEHIRRLR